LNALRRIHLALGLAVSVPLLLWSASGLVYALPGQVLGGASYAAIEPGRIRILPDEALRRASAVAGRTLPTTALTLEQKDGRLAYEAVGGLGMDSITVDAESGAAALTPPPPALTRFFRQAHFFAFAGRAQVPLLAGCALLALCSVLTGLLLAARMLFPPKRRGVFKA
jgi:uncharacterized iron-regulated membrane protein